MRAGCTGCRVILVPPARFAEAHKTITLSEDGAVTSALGKDGRVHFQSMPRRSLPGYRIDTPGPWADRYSFPSIALPENGAPTVTSFDENVDEDGDDGGFQTAAGAVMRSGRYCAVFTVKLTRMEFNNVSFGVIAAGYDVHNMCWIPF